MKELGDPTQHILADPPNVWLTSYYGWTPENWGCLGFSVGGQRQKFLNATQEGALIVIYGAKNKETPDDMRGKVLGFYQTTRELGHSHKWISPMQVEHNKRMGRQDKWSEAVKCSRAWEIVEEDRPTIEDFAAETYKVNNHQHIGSQGVRLLPNEAKKLLGYEFIERDVYGENPIDVSVISKLRPSKGLMPAEKPYSVIVEPDGPKELYILTLVGSTANYLGRTEKGLLDQKIIKVGFSKSPSARCRHFNKSMPKGAFHLEVMRSTKLDGHEIYPDQLSALAGEDKMKVILDEHCESLGGEFFLTHQETIDEAWYFGRRAALKKAKERSNA